MNIENISDEDLIEEIRERDLVDEFADDFDLSAYSIGELQNELGERGLLLYPHTPEEELDHRLEQIWIYYRGKEVPQVLADYLWDTIGKAI